MKNTFGGLLNHNVFSRLMVTVFKFNKLFGPTFVETAFLPCEPQPIVNVGANVKLYKSPIPP